MPRGMRFYKIKSCLFHTFSGIWKVSSLSNNVFVMKCFPAQIIQSTKLQMMVMVLQMQRPPKATSKIIQDSILLGGPGLSEVHRSK